MRHLQHKHADESEDLAAITASYPSPATLPRYSDIGTNENGDGEEVIVQPLKKKPRVIGTGPGAISVDVLEAKIKREEHNLKMWRDAKEEIKALKEELKSATEPADIEEIHADLVGFQKRKATFAKLLGFNVV